MCILFYCAVCACALNFPTPSIIILELFYRLQLELVEAPLSSGPGSRRSAAAAFERGWTHGVLCLLAVVEGFLAGGELGGDNLGIFYFAFLDI